MPDSPEPRIQQQAADIFTKTLCTPVFKDARQLLGMSSAVDLGEVLDLDGLGELRNLII